MNPVYLCGRGLACALGPNLAQSLEALHHGGVATKSCFLNGAMGGHFPYHAISYQTADWNTRAHQLVRSVADEAGVQAGSTGALFIATTSFDIGADATQRNYSAFSDKIVAWLQWSGPVYIINTACTSSLNALIAAHALLSSGELEEAVVLGFELDNKLTLAGFAAMQLLSSSSCKPFGAHRDGLVLGEAVTCLRLSTREPSSWKLLGGANVVDGNHTTGASASAVASMYQRALARCGLHADKIDLIKVQAAGSPGNDSAEAQGLRAAFGKMPALVSLKAALGHTMGASGAAEIALLSACLEQGIWPSYADSTDKTLGVDLVAQMPKFVRYVMATILGFGGSHATVALERV